MRRTYICLHPADGGELGAMSNKRLIGRVRRRLRVILNGAPTFTSDVSPGGFCVELMQVLPRGSDVAGMLELSQQSYAFSGRVAWAVKGEPRLNQRGRMGIQFTGIDHRFFERYEAELPSAG